MKKLFILALVAIAVLAVAVYRAKLGARKSEAAIETMEVEAAALREEVDVLKNEFKHLSREKRLDEIAREELDMAPIRPEQITSPSELAERLEAAREAAGDAQESAGDAGGRP